jgi:hypothetical protein
MSTTTILTMLGAAALVAACGSGFPPPNDQWAAAQTDVGRAEAGGAPSVPEAKLHLQLAEEDLQKAKPFFGEDNERAASLIGRARAEAQLALSLSRKANALDLERRAREDLQKASTTQ